MLLQNVLVLATLLISVSTISDKDTEVNLDDEERLSGGSDAPANTYSATVNILTGDNAASSTHLCQGVIIAPNMTITAASCLYDVTSDTFLKKEKIFLRAGSLDKTVKTNPTPTAVTAMIIYPGFRYYPQAVQFGQDLVLLVPATNFAIDGSNIGVALISRRDTEISKDVFLKETVTVASWGKIPQPRATPVDGPNKLQYIRLQLLKQDSCAQMYLTFDTPLTLQSSSACLNDALVDVGFCEGDAGAGVYVVDAKTRQLIVIGIGSQQLSGKCPTDYPSIFTRVGAFSDWIIKHGGPKPK